ncbi:hypothetical protein TruAng_011476 [Truncatella angustata]|nr:hypothetical protein TruAng_011476 [Truncatella angustata]
MLDRQGKIHNTSPSTSGARDRSTALAARSSILTPRMTSPVECALLVPEREGFLRATLGGTTTGRDLGAESNLVGTPSTPLGAYSPATISSTALPGGFSRHAQDERLDNTIRAAVQPEALDFTGLELLCLINVDEMSSRWLNPYVPVPGQKVKEYPANIEAFIRRILGSYASIAVRGRAVPPFVHSSQTATVSVEPPLSTCLSLIRVCERLLPGSEAAAADVLQREMRSIYEQHDSLDDLASLAALQSYLIYALVQLYRLGGNIPSQTTRRDFISLQDLACASSRRGLVCAAEQRRARPRWEEWIVAEAKRRTLYVTNLLDGVISAQEGLPTFYGFELRGLPAPAGKALWEARSRRDWEMAYTMHLADWPGGGLRVDELWPRPPGLGGEELARRRVRVDRWLEDVDEFGTMIYAVSSSTHDA